jgi:hypothetical protein
MQDLSANKNKDNAIFADIEHRFEALKKAVKFKNTKHIYTHLAWLLKFHSTYTAISYALSAQQVLRGLARDI